jgi:hypothetical protein
MSESIVLIVINILVNIYHENNYYRKLVTYHDVLPSILSYCSGERWTDVETTSPTAEDGISPKPVQCSPEH